MNAASRTNLLMLWFWPITAWQRQNKGGAHMLDTTWEESIACLPQHKLTQMLHTSFLVSLFFLAVMLLQLIASKNCG